MKKNIINIRILIPFLFFTFYGCIKPLVRCPDIYTINKNIVKLKLQLDDNMKPHFSAVWVNGSTLYYNGESIKINNQLQVSSIINIPELEKAQIINLNPSRTKILWVEETLNSYEIKEYNIQTNTTSTVLTAENFLSDALYYHDDEHIVYVANGIYLFDRVTNETILIYTFPEGVTNSDMTLSKGFDVHPVKNILLIPFTKLDEPAQILSHNVDLGQTDTLITFAKNNYNYSLWLRYNRNGDKVVFSHYPSIAYNYSDIGIIDMNTLEIQMLDVNTSKVTESLNLFPNWSPDYNHIIYRSDEYGCSNKKNQTKYSPIEPRPYLDLYILKNVN